MAKRLTILLFLSICIDLVGCQPNVDRMKAEIIEVTENMADCWNRGDLEAYMAYYAKSDSITFQSNTMRWYGWETVRSMFVNIIPDEAQRGSLRFSEIEIKAISEHFAFAAGKFHLTYLNGQIREGYFTVLYQKFPDGWKIVHDHS